MAPSPHTGAATAWLQTTLGAQPLQVRVARSFSARLRGLMLARPLAPRAGLLIPGCSSVHTCFMRFEIDLVYLDGIGCVTQCVAAVKPWRMNLSTRRRGHPPAHHVLELAAGAVDRLRIAPGNQFRHAHWQP